MLARFKILYQFAIATRCRSAVVLDCQRFSWLDGRANRARVLIDIGIWYVPVAAFIITAAANAVNLTDGLDGLAGIIAATAFTAYGIIAFYARSAVLADLSASSWLAPHSPFYGSMPIRRRCSWVTWAHKPLVVLSR